MQQTYKDTEDTESQADAYGVKLALSRQDVVGALRANVCVMVS